MRWYAGAILLLLIGMLVKLSLLVYAMYALLALLLVSRYLARSWIDNMSATRECSRPTAEIGDRVAMVVNLNNDSPLPVPWMLVEDSVSRESLLQKPPRMKVEGRRAALFPFRPHAQKSLLYQLDFLMRGYYQIGPLLMESGDLFGLHRRWRVLTRPHFIPK